MADYVFKSDSADRFVEWINPNIWINNIVPNNVEADVYFPTTTYIETGNAYFSYITITPGSALTTHSVSLENNGLILEGSLNVGATMSILTGGQIQMSGGTLSADTIASGGRYIQGRGIINADHFINNSEIVGSGLTINSSSFQNNGDLIAASGTLDINTDPGGFSGIISGNLTGSSYTVGNSAIYLNVGETISSTDASVNLYGGSTIYSYDSSTDQFVSLQSSLHDVLAGGSLSLTSGNYIFENINISGELEIYYNHATSGEATLSADEIKILSGGLLHGEGTVSAPLINDGIIQTGSSDTSTEDLILNGPISGSGLLEISLGAYTTGRNAAYFRDTLEIRGTTDQDVRFENNIGQLTLGDVHSYSGTIIPSTIGITGPRNLVGNVVLIKDVSLASVTDVTYLGNSSGGTLSLDQASGTISLKFEGDFTQSSFTLAEGPRTLSTDPHSLKITVNAGVGGGVCFASGTRIRTLRGDVAVEALRVGDYVATASGAPREIVWIGCRTLRGIADPSQGEGWPVRVAAHAFGAGAPSRDLYLSADHAVCVDILGEVFIPVGRLINGSTIAPVAVDEVTYWHIELESHDVLFANDLPSESYLDMGNRSWFAGADLPVALESTAQSRARYFRPFVDHGPIVKAVRVRLKARARDRGWVATYDMEPHLMVDGVRIDGDIDQGLARFTFPAGARDVRLVSQTFVPAQAEQNGDFRTLGIGITGLTLEDGLGERVDVPLDHPALNQLDRLEREGELAWRWTNGSLQLGPQLWQGLRSHVILRIAFFSRGGRRWIAPESDQLAGSFEEGRATNVVRLRA